MIKTLDSESSNVSSNLDGTYFIFYSISYGPGNFIFYSISYGPGKSEICLSSGCPLTLSVFLCFFIYQFT